MILNLSGLLLSFSIAMHFLTIYFAVRQKVQVFFIPLFVYLNLLLALGEISAIFLLQEKLSQFEHIIFQIYLISYIFIPPVLVQLNQNYSLSTFFPKITLRTILFFGISFLISLTVLAGYFIKGGIIRNGIVYPEFTSWYWIFIFYFYSTFYYLIVDFFKKFRLEKRKPEFQNLKTMINFIIPVAILSFACLHFLPFFGIIHPAVVLGLPVISLLTIFTALKSNLLDYDESFSNFILFSIISILFIFFISLIRIPNHFYLYLLSVLVLILIFVISVIGKDLIYHKIR